MALPFGGWYHATKFAVEGLSDSLRQEVASFGVDVVLIEPGSIRTEWGGIAAESLLEVSGDGGVRRPRTPCGEQPALTAGGAPPSSPDVVARAIEKASTAVARAPATPSARAPSRSSPRARCCPTGPSTSRPGG